VVAPTARGVLARKRVVGVLVGEGFVETLNFSFLAEKRAREFLNPGSELVGVDSDRRKLEPILRPSLVPSLMAVRKTNQDLGNAGLRLFEIGNAWSRVGGRIVESRRLCLLVDVPRQAGKSAQPDYSLGARTMLGVVRELLTAVGGQVSITMRPGDRPGYMYSARVLVDGVDLGFLGLVSEGLHELFKLRARIAVAELDFDALVGLYPPKTALRDLPRLPGVERELSIIVPASVTWEQIHAEIVRIWPAKLEELEHLDTYSGAPIPPEKKSVSLRLRFRDPEVTLRSEDVEPQTRDVMEALNAKLGAEIRVS
jgi:phenylalanyl-tRNA synthetase beta chain